MFGPFGHICGIGDIDPHRLDTTTVLPTNVEERSDETDKEVLQHFKPRIQIQLL